MNELTKRLGNAKTIHIRNELRIIGFSKSAQYVSLENYPVKFTGQNEIDITLQSEIKIVKSSVIRNRSATALHGQIEG